MAELINKPIQPQPQKSFKEHKVTMQNCRTLVLTGVEKVHAINESQVHVNVLGGGLLVGGLHMHVQKLSVEEGLLEIEGDIYEIKYLKPKDKTSFFKRVFK